MSLFRRIRLYGGLTAVLISVLLPVSSAYAQSAPLRPPLNLMTSPLPLNVITKPGVPVTADLRVKNNGTQPEQLKVDLLKFGAAGDTGQPQLQERVSQDLFFNWVHFSESNFTAEPNVWKTIQMTISPPKEAAFGYYYAVLFTRATPDKPTGGQSAVEGGVASLVLLNVDAPGARREAHVVSLQATQKVYEFLPAEFSIRLHNSGNIHVSPAGTMFIKHGDSQVAAIDFNSEHGNILPGTDRVFKMSWKDGFPVYDTKESNGKTTRGSLKWDFSQIQKFRFGRYTVNLVAVYDDGQRDVPIEATVSFWVIPWRILGIILVILLIIGAGIWGILRLIWKGLRRQATAPVSDEPAPNSLAAAPKRSRKKKAAANEETEAAEEEAAPKASRTTRRPAVKKAGQKTTQAAPAPRKKAAKKVVEAEIPEETIVTEPIVAETKTTKKVKTAKSASVSSVTKTAKTAKTAPPAKPARTARPVAKAKSTVKPAKKTSPRTRTNKEDSAE